MPRVAPQRDRRPVEVELWTSLIEVIQDRAHKTGETFDDIVNSALEAFLGKSTRQHYLSGRQSINAVHITAPIITLVEGLLRGEKTVGEALRHGDFGLGTLNDLDGEVVVLDGVAYQQGADGSSRTVEGAEKTPFMTMTFLEKDSGNLFDIPSNAEKPMDLHALQQFLKSKLTSPNLFHAIRIQGHFPFIKARAVRKQSRQRSLVEVTREQAVFEFHDEEGLLIGFYSPPFVGAAIAVPGFHLHFLSADRQRGGHVLDCTLSTGAALMHPLYRTEADMPHSADFLHADLNRDPLQDIREAETGT